MVYIREGDIAILWCTPWKGILQFQGVYTMEARNGFRGVHHGRGFWIFVVYTIVGDFAISWCIRHYTMEAKTAFHGVHHRRGFWIFVVYTIEGDFGFSWCTPWMEILKFNGIDTMEAKNGFHGVHNGRGFCNFVAYTMEGDFEISWCIHH